MVVHGMLLCKLRNAQNYSVSAGMLVRSYISERPQFVRWSRIFHVVFFSWSALVYIIYRRRLKGYQVLPFSLFADDLQIYHSCAVPDFQRCIDELNLDLQRVHEWAAANGLKLNPRKRQVIVIAGLIFHLSRC
jgi:hypothetical protein